MLTKKIKTRLLFLVSIILIILSFLIFIYLNLKQNILYFKTPSEIFINNQIKENSMIRVGGMVKKDSIRQNNKEIKFSSDLPHVVGQIQPESKAKGKIIRDGKEIELKFTLGELPVNQDSFIPAKSQGSADPIGIKVAEIDRDNPSMANLPDGVVVSRVNPGSPASGKVMRGDLITMIQYKGSKYQVFDVESYEESIENFSSGDKIALHLNRNGSRIIRSITIN